MFDGYYEVNVEINSTLSGLPNVKTSDHKSRGLAITRTLNSVVQNTANQAIYLNATLPGGSHVFAMADVIDTNVGSYSLTYPDSMLREVGAVSAELTIIDPTGVLSTCTFTINVTEAVSDYSQIEDSANYPGLLQALALIQTFQSQITTLQSQVAGIEHFGTGTIVMSPTALDSNFWVPLIGQSTSAYSTLSPIFGATFPNMNGRVAVQIDSTQAEFNTLGLLSGDKTHWLTPNEMPVHSHNLCMYASNRENNGHFALATAKQSGGFLDRAMVYTANSSYTAEYEKNAGGDAAHNNLQPYGILGKYYVHI